jgi:hypothetical protein
MNADVRLAKFEKKFKLTGRRGVVSLLVNNLSVIF